MNLETRSLVLSLDALVLSRTIPNLVKLNGMCSRGASSKVQSKKESQGLTQSAD